MNQISKIGPTAQEKSNWQMNNSEYTKRYQKFEREDQLMAKPPAVRKEDNQDTFRLGDEMHTHSSYMEDYAQKPADRPVRVKHRGGPSSIAAPPGAQMDCNSSYNECFDKKNCRPAKSIKPPPPQGLSWKTESGANMAPSSVNKGQYRSYTEEEIGGSKRKPIIISPEYGTIDVNPDTRPKMDFSTTVSNNFVKHEGNCRPQPAPGAIKTPAHGIAGIAGADINAKMDLTTTHQNVFNNKALDDELVAVPPLAKDKRGGRPKWYRSADASNDQMSTQMNDYVKHNGVCRPKSFQPKMEYEPPATKFHTETLYGGAFTEKGRHRREPMIPATRTRDDEIIRTVMGNENIYQTEYDQTYQEAPTEFKRPASIVPKTSNRSAGKFYEGTSYTQNFNCDQDRSVARVPSFKPKKADAWYKAQNHTADSEHFKSTTQEHYQGERAMPAEICKPKIKKDQAICRMDRDVHFETEYNNCFQNQNTQQ